MAGTISVKLLESDGGDAGSGVHVISSGIGTHLINTSGRSISKVEVVQNGDDVQLNVELA
jgi:hypothetical protein